MSVEFFRYPLQMGVLEAFCHPEAGHLFSRPVFHGGEALAGNGYVLIRCHRGLWMGSDFEEAADGFLERFEGAGWDGPEPRAEDWRSAEEMVGPLFRRGPVGMWLGGRCAPSPVWRVGGAFLGRVSHLQLIARLPRCEVAPPRGRAEERNALRFRFSGGHGLMAHDARLTEASFEGMAPVHCRIDGQEVKRERGLNWNFGKPPVEEPRIDGWPPVDSM